MSKYVRVMDGLKSNASGEEFRLDEVITSKIWKPKEIEADKMGGFNFSTEDKILRYIFRGDTIYDVIIPDNCDKTLAEMSDEERRNRNDGHTSATELFAEWYKNTYLKQCVKKLSLS